METGRFDTAQVSRVNRREPKEKCSRRLLSLARSRLFWRLSRRPLLLGFGSSLKAVCGEP